jgi:hypothetical protein
MWWNKTAKGLVSTTDGTTPFYTNITNPVTIASLTVGSCKNVSWPVNATGDVGDSYDFYAYANKTDGTTNSQTNILNVNITDYSPATPNSCIWDGTSDHTYQCKDECNIISEVNARQNKISFNGSDGRIVISANIQNASDITIYGGCNVICSGGCFT